MEDAAAALDPAADHEGGKSIGLALALASSAFIGCSFIIKKRGLRVAGSSGVRAGARALDSSLSTRRLNAPPLRWPRATPACALVPVLPARTAALQAAPPASFKVQGSELRS